MNYNYKNKQLLITTMYRSAENSCKTRQRSNVWMWTERQQTAWQMSTTRHDKLCVYNMQHSTCQ